MNVTLIELFAGPSMVFECNLLDPSFDSPYLLRGVLGLDALDITPKFYGFGPVDNKIYDFAMPPREIVMRLAFNPNRSNSVGNSDLRDNLYRSIAAYRGGQVELRFHSGTVSIMSIKGFVTKLEVPHSSNVAEAQITIRCDDPLFRSTVASKVDITQLGIVPSSDDAYFTISNPNSTAPCGIEMQFICTSNIAEFEIVEAAALTQEEPEWVFNVKPGGTGFKIGDILKIDSGYLKKAVIHMAQPSLTEVSIVDKVALESVWPILFPGMNTFGLRFKDSWDLVEFVFTPTYWGI